MKNRVVTLSFARWPNLVGKEEEVFARLLEIAIGRDVRIVDSEHETSDIQIESVYGKNEIPDLSSRLYRFLASHTKTGINFSKEEYSSNQQPSGNSKYSIFFTGENERPPFGKWDAYLSFDLNSYGEKNAYLPLWWLTSSDLIQPTVSPYLGKEISINEMLSPRVPDWDKRKKFCVAFIGKAYPFRMQAIAALSQVGKVDVYGGIARNQDSKRARLKFETSQEYRFVFAFENDLFPGYVTEKAPEAWATGAVPLYWGSDPKNYLNQNALLNLANFRDLDEYIAEVKRVDSSAEAWSQIASQPLLAKRPNLEEVISVLRKALKPLIKD
jgi:hypothetical protein